MIEVPVFSVESAIAAMKGGAGRLEVCSGFPEGGTTPSFGLLTLIKEKVNIPVHAMIRPRGGDFLYSEYEFEIMKRDTMHCRSLGIEGVVFGILLPNGDVDVERCKTLVEFARPMSVTFHRAFDRCREPFIALNTLVDCGFNRLLTSGQAVTADKGTDLIVDLIKDAGNSLIVMPGAGVNEKNIGMIAKTTGAVEFHLSGKVKQDSLMEFRREEISMKSNGAESDYEHYFTSAEKIMLAREVLESLVR
ncbi:MAG: copper homeostasis protein CutC [Bacteroidota bacterium]